MSAADKELTRQIGELEREIQDKQRVLSEMRRRLPREKVADHQLLGPGGERVPLTSLFGVKKDLIVVHNMRSKCPYCTLWADGLNGVLPHLQARAAFAVVSPDPPDMQASFAAGRGWKFPMFSNADSGFTEAMGYVREEGGHKMFWPGFSTFTREPDGTVTRVAHASFGPGDPYCGAWHLFAILAGGVEGWEPKLRY